MVDIDTTVNIQTLIINMKTVYLTFKHMIVLFMKSIQYLDPNIHLMMRVSMLKRDCMHIRM